MTNETMDIEQRSSVLHAFLKEGAERDVWDERPVLFLIVRESQEVSDGVHLVSWAIADLELPPELYDGDPVFLIQTLTTFLRIEPGAREKVLGRIPPGWAFRGVGLRNEGWQVSVDKDADPAKVAEVRAAGEAHTLNEHPERKEVKLITAADENGVCYWGHHVRGETETPAVENNADDLTATEGRVPEAIRELANVLSSSVPSVP